MKTYELHIKNMVCERCIVYVQQVLQQLNVSPNRVELGYVIFSAPYESVLPLLEKKLNEVGLQIVHDKTEATIEEIKVEIIKYLNEVENGKKLSKLSEYLADQLARNYFSLTKLFSKNENTTIESYVINQKVERVKRLLREGELTVSEIAYRLGYSNVQHLSNQFKKVTGLSVSEFKASLGVLSRSYPRSLDVFGNRAIAA
ncbi:MAG TPA: AraC family transcriptional regulator [Cyclobacteriaceae bacterium]|nr:AraC family transcriptional regulator [Cyclobacteriaceae bacterium]HRJ80966.1 AraC family transcriptional regulator [Cyclobacteriaceae bacterium]